MLEKEIAQRLGPSVARRVAELEVGESIVVGEGDSAYVVRLLERRGGELAAFEEARPAVEAAYLRQRSELAVREFLDVARKRSDVVVGPQ